MPSSNWGATGLVLKKKINALALQIQDQQRASQQQT